MIIFHTLIFLISFIFIWIGAGLIVRSTDNFSRRFKISSFAMSFFILGILTSVPEFSVGLNSIVRNEPEIFVGNLIGGVIVIFLLIIPLLAIIGNGIKLSHQLDSKKLLLSLIVIASPTFLISDGRITLYEAVLLILLYFILFIFFEKKKEIIETIESNFLNEKKSDWKDIFKILIGVVIVFFASRFIVIETEYLASFFKISPFLISLVFLSLGTNLPELSVGLKSLALGKKDVAFGDYIGSASANTLLFGVLTLINKGDIIVPNHFFERFVFLIIGLTLFYLFSRSKNDISRTEGGILLFVYLLFFLVEII